MNRNLFLCLKITGWSLVFVLQGCQDVDEEKRYGKGGWRIDPHESLLAEMYDGDRYVGEMPPIFLFPRSASMGITPDAQYPLDGCTAALKSMDSARLKQSLRMRNTVQHDDEGFTYADTLYVACFRYSGSLDVDCEENISSQRRQALVNGDHIAPLLLGMADCRERQQITPTRRVSLD